HTSGASINVSLKSGTNAFHGTLGASVSSGPMMTRNFFTNRFIFDPRTGPITPEKIKANTPSLRWLRYSGAVGGPVYIPKVYDGRSKTFWMFGYQSHNRRRPNATQNSVPTLPQREGDFSDLLALGSQYQIYDPATTQPAGSGRFRRQPLPGNIIPQSRIDPAARNILKYFPLPNTAGTADFKNNYTRTRQDTQDLYQPVARVDHNFSENHRMFARYSHSQFYGHFDELIADSRVRGRKRQRPHRGVALDNVFVLSPRIVLDVRYGFTWFREWQSFDNIGWDLSEFGFPSSLFRELDPAGISFPQIGASGYLQLGNDGGFQRTNYSHSLLSVLNWSRGSHSLKFGFDGRLLLETNKNYGNISPRLDFGQTYTRGPLDNSPVAPAGQGLASLLFGIPTGGWVDFNDSRAESTRFYGAFAQDDWRLTRNLTLNLGVRWEYEGPTTERFNRSTRDFDFTTPNPIEAQARANYARSPIPQVPPSQFRTVGGATFLGVGVPRGIRDPYYRSLMPRVGFAYQVARRAVVRGGYGIYFGLIGAEFTDVPQPGFNQRTNVVASLDNGQSYVASISNPLPFGIEKPLGAQGGLETFLGRSPGFVAADGRRPYTQRWSYSVQIEPAARTVIEIGYLGSRAARLRSGTQFNAIPREYLSTLPTRDQATIDRLSARATNPFRGLDGFRGTALFASANTSVGQLLRPYPQFSGLSTGLPAGSSWYHAMTMRFERRFQKGFQAQAIYTWSKTMEAAAYLNDTDSIPEHVVSNLDRPHRLTVSVMYELPFGKGRPLLSSAGGVLNHIIGGWQVQGIFQGQSGPPLAFGNVIYTGQYRDLKLTGAEQSINRWFNTSGFERNPRLQLANNIRTFPSRIATVRADGINVWDLAAHKNFRLMEGLTLQLRGEAEGAMNHPNFAGPNLNPAGTLFGMVTGTQGGQEERRTFVGLKLLF
ncbi:MAG: TonB-dependent receptor, partial [Acidobacteria bacterium]|nr:TonB-dependent receptor [Acidobacteriota bacterium]